MHRRRVLDKPITYVGLDVHKDTVAVALAEAGGANDVRVCGKITNTPAALKAMAAKLSRGGRQLRFCYADRLMSRIRNPDRRQFASTMQLGQADRVPTIGLDPIARFAWDQ